MNPDAEESVTQRFHNAKTRLRNELQDQLQSRIEALDEQVESLEYIREKAELCNVEAKVIVTNYCAEKMLFGRNLFIAILKFLHLESFYVNKYASFLLAYYCYNKIRLKFS